MKAPRDSSEDVLMTRNNEVGDQGEKRSLHFIALCVILTAILFILIDTVVYFTDRTGAASRSTETFETAKPGDKAMRVLP